MTFQAPPPDAPRGDGDGGIYDYYINWHAQGSAKHGIQPACFSLRASGAGNVPTSSQHMEAGTVWDVENIETGWQIWPDGGQKDYRPNPTPAQPAPFPGAGWTEAVKIPVALDANTAACWDQASVGTWRGFHQIAAVIAQQHPQNPGLYPLIKLTGSILTATGQNSTSVPQFEIVQWVQQPACFNVHSQPVAPAPQPAVFASAPLPQPVAQPAPAAPMAPAALSGAWNT